MADLSFRTGLAQATPPLLPPIDPSEQRKFVCHYLNSQSCRDEDPEQGRSFIDAVDLLKGDHAKRADEALARSMAKPIWRADFAALLLHGYYLDSARGMDALEHLRRISSAVGQDGVTEVTALVRTYDALLQDKKARRVAGELELRRADVFRVAVELDSDTMATRIPAIFIDRYEAVSALVGRQRAEIDQLQSKVKALMERGPAASQKKVNTLTSILALLDRHWMNPDRRDSKIDLYAFIEAAAEAVGHKRAPAAFEIFQSYIDDGKKTLGRKVKSDR